MGRLDDAAKAVLAEYHAIRKEYKSLDREDPAHTKRRQELKERYYELDRRYAHLVKRSKAKARDTVPVPEAPRSRRRHPVVKPAKMRPPRTAPAPVIQRPASSRVRESIRSEKSAGEGLPPVTAQRPAPESPTTAKVLALGGWSIVAAGIALGVSFISGFGRDAVIDLFEAVNLSVVAELKYGLIASGAIIVLGATLIGIAAFARYFLPLIVPIHELARKGRVDALARAIAIGADIEARDRRGCTPLHFAVVAGHETAAHVLLDNGANLEAVNERGETPLFMAAANRDLALANALIRRGASVHATNENGSNLMHIAAWAGDLELTKVAEACGLDCQQRTKQGYTALHFAAQSGNLKVLERLLAAGAAPDASCNSGATPLCAAAGNGHVALMRALIDAGADVNAKRGYDYAGPLAVALEGKHAAAADLLRKHGATAKRAQSAA